MLRAVVMMAAVLDVHERTGEQDEIWECQEKVASVRQEQQAADGGNQQATNEAGRRA